MAERCVCLCHDDPHDPAAAACPDCVDGERVVYGPPAPCVRLTRCDEWCQPCQRFGPSLRLSDVEVCANRNRSASGVCPGCRRDGTRLEAA